MVKRRVEWNGSINSRECLLPSSHPRGPRHRGTEERGIKTIDRELVRGGGIVRSVISYSSRRKEKDDGRNKVEQEGKERPVKFEKKKKKNEERKK